MASIETAALDPSLTPEQLWREFAVSVLQWLDGRGRSRRDAIIILPFAELLAPCRAALAACGGWQPRAETLRTLLAALPPSPQLATDAPSGDAALDSLVADRWLSQLPGARQWRGRDRLAYEQAVADVVQAAHTLALGAAQQLPAMRAQWWTRAGLAAANDGNASGIDAALTRLAVNWAGLGDAPSSDGLGRLRPSAWVVLEAGGHDPGAQALLTQAKEQGVACLRVNADVQATSPTKADAPALDPIAALARSASARLWTVPTLEDEAWAAATLVIEAIAAGQVPVALIAQDRLLTRRIRALLERRRVSLSDESGWPLSTTRAAANVLAVLRATHPSAGPDAWLDGLKACTTEAQAALLDHLERHWRRGGQGAPNARALHTLTWWQDIHARWQAFAAPPRQALCDWLGALATLAAGVFGQERWQHDAAALAVRSALRLDSASVRDDVDATAMGLDDFIAWVQAVLEQASFIPLNSGAQVQVVITPLARAILRPFAVVVLPGADERSLGASVLAPNLLSDAMLSSLGLDSRRQREHRAAQAFAQLLRHPQVHLLRRLADGAEQLGPSPWVDRWQWARHIGGLPPLVEHAAAEAQAVLPACPVLPPRPCAAQHLPKSVSASAVEALRACPYRFFARSVLRLGDVAELDDGVDKRDHGSLLHAALHRFHEQRRAQGAAADDEGALVALYRDEAIKAGLQVRDLLPYTAGMSGFARRYVQWLSAREAQAWYYEGGELEVHSVLAVDALADRRAATSVDTSAETSTDTSSDSSVVPFATTDPARDHPLQLRGRIDRVDRHHSSAAMRLIDYKTGSVASLRDKLKRPLEDTQLAFYALQLILAQGGAAELSAAYLALDDREKVIELEHPDVAASALSLATGLAHDWRRLRDGSAMLALGEGKVCETCEARGLCRRDHWAVTPAVVRK